MIRSALCLTLLSVAPAAAVECRLALALALDVSSSVNTTEDALQRGGLAAALLAPEVRTSILAGDPIAMAVYEWSGRYNQEVLASWRVIRSEQDLQALSRTIAASRRSHDEFPTAMGYALGFAWELFQEAPRCLYQTLDMAGDGESNEGFPPEAAYREYDFNDITVNGLVVNAADFEAEVDLIEWYRTEVLHGPGAFLEVAQGFEDYERAMRRKLERETRPRIFGGLQ